MGVFSRRLKQNALFLVASRGFYFYNFSPANYKGPKKMIDRLLFKIEKSDRDGVSDLLKDEISKEAWAIHLSLYPLVQRVANPPFINPHLPKMYRIYRELLPYLDDYEIPGLLRLEISEYTRRPKSEELKKVQGKVAPTSFNEIKAGIRQRNREKVAMLLNAFFNQEGGDELARNLILLGSGYLDQSLGHSVSCTAFILLEMIERSNEADPWPALATLADYFCNGGFHTTPDLRGTVVPLSLEALNQHLLRATSGSGIVNLHHTITRFSIERVRHFLNKEEYAHMIACWIEFMGSKGVEAPSLVSSSETLPEYGSFFQSFSSRAERPVLSYLEGMLPSEKGRRYLGHHLVKGICDLYQGDYDPHFLTGLASALWVVTNYWNETPIAVNGLRQYLNYYFTQLSS